MADWVTALQVASPQLKASDLVEYGDIDDPKRLGLARRGREPLRSAIGIPAARAVQRLIGSACTRGAAMSRHRPFAPDRGGAGALRRRRLAWAGALLGFALGGFFDGILLHQILQWHHLLSAVDAPGLADLRMQVLADGAFHALMYVVAVAGLVLLVRAHRLPPEPGDASNVAAFVAVGFGAWHVIDTLVSHWWLGIHRIRMDVPNPLAWDLLWLFLFGLPPLVLGGVLRRRAARAAQRSSRWARPGAAGLALLVVGAGAVALRPPPDGGPLLVVTTRDAGPDRVLDAAAVTGAGLLWFDARAGLWLLEAPADADVGEFRARGALYAGRSAVAVGCASWLRARGG